MKERCGFWDQGASTFVTPYMASLDFSSEKQSDAFQGFQNSDEIPEIQSYID
jgi:hypothetical protein